MTLKCRRVFFLASYLCFATHAFPQQAPDDLPAYIRDNYTKATHQIKVRDGVRLYTIVYCPKDRSRTYPILLNRTPYSIGPYEEDKFRDKLGPNKYFPMEGYIFVYQDVRGRYMSEGEFENVRPHNPSRKSEKDIDESTDTYDTIDWLVKNVKGHNGRVGMYGISYPGFYTAAGMIDAHPALKAASPQAPIADWFFDDFYRHGCFYLPHAFNFFAFNGLPRPKPTVEKAAKFEYGTPDGYQFYMDLGSLKNVNPKHFKGRVDYWNKLAEHHTYDDFWKARNLLPHLKKVAPAVMTVGGWFDAEDLYGALKTYAAVERQNPGIYNVLVMGPWSHGGWERAESNLGAIHWGTNTSDWYQKNIELPFFNRFLKDKSDKKLPEATVFETGTNAWREFSHWPPKDARKQTWHFHPKSSLRPEPPKADDAFDAFISDPSRPVPYTERLATGMAAQFMIDDQRYASRRPDVLVYQSDVLKRDLTLAGPLLADLHVATSATDCDWVVKVIDVFPGDYKESPLEFKDKRPLGGYQMLVRSEVIRGRFRNSYSRPEPFEPNQPARIKLELQDVLHTFRKGHRLMVQVSSTWFPLIDRNPQKYVPNIFEANEDDFIAARHKVYRSATRASGIEVGVLVK